jgi:hypothetical protein
VLTASVLLGSLPENMLLPTVGNGFDQGNIILAEALDAFQERLPAG